MISNIYLIFVVIVGNGITAIDANPAVPKEVITSELLLVVNFSGRGVGSIAKDAFDDAYDVGTLNFSNNYISGLPEFVFSKMRSLKNLSLANNLIKTTRNAFAMLDKLEILDISYNPLTSTLDDNFFFGLGKSCWILMKGVVGIEEIKGDVFGDETSTPLGDLTRENGNRDNIGSKSMQRRALSSRSSGSEYENKNDRFQICMRKNVVQRLDFFNTNRIMRHDCREIKLDVETLILANLNISDFEESWYRLRLNISAPNYITAIDLSGNNIVRITRDIMDAIPNDITWLELDRNKIERLVENTFVHDGLTALHLGHNQISEIEDNAFATPWLDRINLENNRLKDTKFAATLPVRLAVLHLEFNEITEISADSLSHLEKLHYLNVNNNKITTVGSHSLRGATGLGLLMMQNNEITTVERGAFDNLSPYQIFLGGNKISGLEVGVLTRLDDLLELDLSRNEFTKISRGMFDLPRLEVLNMSGNHITDIEKGSMRNLGGLYELNISKNPIKKLINGALFGLRKIRETAIFIVGTPLEAIQAGLFDDV